MREFRIKVNNEKTYVVKANDYNQAVKTLHSKLSDFDLTNFLALKRSLELRIGEEIDFDKLEEYVNKLPKDKNGKKNVDVKEVIKCCVKAKDNSVSDSVSKYNGEDAIKTNGFVKIKEDGDWTSYKYNGSDFDNAVFKIHQYNPSLIAFVSNGNKTITVRNKYLNDADNTAQGEIEVLKSFGFDYKDGKWVKESNNNDIIVQPDYHYVSVIGPGDTEKHCKKYQYQSAGMLKKIIASNIKDSSITDTDMKIAEDIIKKYGGNPVGNVMGLQKTRFVGQDEIKNQHDFTTDLDKAGYKFYLINGRYRISPKDSSIKDVSYVSGKNLKIGQKIVEDGEVLEVVDIKETQRGVNNNYRDVTLKNVKTGATETVHFGNSTLARLNDYSIKDSDSYQVWTINEKGVYHKEADVPNPQLAKAIASQLKKQGRWVQISKNSRTNIVSDCNMMDSLSIKVKLNGKTYNGVFNGISNADKTFGDVYIPELVSLHSGDKGVFNPDEGHYVSDGKFYFKMENIKKWNPSLKNYLTDSNITDADPVKVEKIIRKEKSALGVTYYIFQTKSSSGYTIYYQVTDKTYHGEPTYSGGGIISFSLKSANDTLDHNLLADKLKAKYGEKEGTKRYLRGENDSAICDMAETDMSMLQNAKRVPAHNIYYNRVSYDDLKRTINKVMEEGNDKDVVNILIGQLSELRKDYEADIKNSKLDKEETKRHYGEYKRLVNNYKNSHISKEYTNAVNSFLSAIKDSNNIKNRKSYTIKVGDKQYKVFAESESEAINKYIKSKKQ